jgi:hypothetical protein
MHSRSAVRSRRSSLAVAAATGLALALCLTLGAGAAAAYPSCKVDPRGLTVCFGHFALCDKAVCKALPGGKTAECTCPVLDGPSFADPGQTNGTCTPTHSGEVYSFFSLQDFKSNGVLACPSGSHWAQCWNAPCRLQPGGTEAKCVCPLCNSSYVTPGGDCNTANCGTEILVGAGFPVKGGARCAASQ